MNFGIDKSYHPLFLMKLLYDILCLHKIKQVNTKYILHQARK